MNVPAVIDAGQRLPENYGLVPSNMSDAMRLAEMMATAKLVPLGLQKSPADCLMVIQQAVRWQMDPFAVAQECSVIQGKLMHSGKLVAAVVNARGRLAERLRFDYEGQGDNRTIKVSGRMEGETAPREVVVKLRDARTNNAMWTKQPDQQLMYHGSRVWARRHTPELMLGVYSPEEFDEGPRTSLPKKDARDIYTKLQAEVDRLESRADLERWEADNAERLAVLPEDWGDILRLRIQERRLDLARPTAVVTSMLDEQPEAGEVIWGEGDGTPAEWSSKWDELGPVKQAGILCGEQSFWTFLNDREAGGATIITSTEAAEYVRKICKVKSRADIKADNFTGQLWRDLVAEYRAWQRADTASPAKPDTAKAPPSATNPSQAEGGASRAAADEMIKNGPLNADHDPAFIEGLDKLLGTAADGGVEALKVMWDKVPKTAQKQLKASLDRRHKPRAAEVDAIKQPA